MQFINKKIYQITTKTFNRRISVQINEDLKIKYLQGKHEGIVEFGLNRPSARNSLNRNLLSCFTDAIQSVQHDKNVRVVIIRSLVPRIFCAGADLKEREKLTPSEVSHFVSSLRSMMAAIENLSMPVLAALDGTALGGGLELALACDIRTASSVAKMGLVETKLAILPGAGGTQRLPRLINPSVAKELIFTAKTLDGKQAYDLGIVNHYVEQNEQGTAAYEKALEISEEILPNGPLGIQWAKMAINQGAQVNLTTGLKIEEAAYAQVIKTKDRIEGLRAFQEKRAPKYIGE